MRIFPEMREAEPQRVVVTQDAIILVPVEERAQLQTFFDEPRVVCPRAVHLISQIPSETSD
jgi:hypothetical protein